MWIMRDGDSVMSDSLPGEVHQVTSELGARQIGASAIIGGMTWSAFYKQARARMASWYGVRGIPVDTYKEAYFDGMTVNDLVLACQRIWEQFHAKVPK